jgi:hypothetical protein
MQRPHPTPGIALGYTVSIAYSVDERAWYGGTGYLTSLRMVRVPTATLRNAWPALTFPKGFPASVYVCGDDHNPQTPPYDNRWRIFDKYLRVYVDGVKVYELTRILVVKLLFQGCNP